MGTIVGEWNYDDVKNASDDTNKIKVKQKSNDIRDFAYYGSAAELVRASVENIVNTFPGIITHRNSKLNVLKPDQTEYYEIDYAEIINEFNIDFIHKSDDDKTKYKFLRSSYSDYLINDKPITKYKVIDRKIYQYYCSDPNYNNCLYKCYNNIKEHLYTKTFTAPSQEISIDEILITNSFAVNIKDYFPHYGCGDSGSDKNYNPIFLEIKKNGEIVKDKGFNVYNRHQDGDSECTELGVGTKTYFKITYNIREHSLKFFKKTSNTDEFSTEPVYTYSINLNEGETCSISLYIEYCIKRRELYTQMMTNEEHESPNPEEYPDYDLKYWTAKTCKLRDWLPNTSFQRICDCDFDEETNDFKYILVSEASHKSLDDIVHTDEPNRNLPLYDIFIYTDNNEETPTAKIYAYILNNEIIYLTDYTNSEEEPFVIRPKDEIIENFFNGLDHFEQLLLNRDSKPLYSNVFITPFERIDKVFYYPRNYTWPSYGGYCIDISSSNYAQYVNSLMDMAEKMDELWTDNIYRRMTHEAIRNYDWTYTREFIEGDEQANVLGGERMENVLHIIGRIFDDVKLYIDTMKHTNRITFNGYQNLPDALLSEMLEVNGFGVCSIIPHFYDCCTKRTLKNGDKYIDCETFEEKTAETDSEYNIISDCFCYEKYLTYGQVYIDGDDRKTKSAEENGNYWVYEEPKITESDLRTFVSNKDSNEEVWYPTTNVERVTISQLDIEFMKKLILCSKRIFTTKGTCHAIEMMMGMFGYGLNDDFKITEYYRETKPINYDDRLSGQTESIGDLIVRINQDKRLTRQYDDDVSGIPVGSFALNQHDQQGNVVVQEGTNRPIQDTYIIPYYTMERDYDGDLYYQQKGGWGMDLTKQVIYSELHKPNPNLTPSNKPLNTALKKVISREFVKNGIFEGIGEKITISELTPDDNGFFIGTINIDIEDVDAYKTYDIKTDGLNLFYKDQNIDNAEWSRTSCLSEYGWTETLSYLHVASDIPSLLSININNLNNGDIYYVCNLREYMEYAPSNENNEIPTLYSNFFGLTDVFESENLSGWKNINLDDEDDIFYEKANYLNNLISINEDNNPHVGYSEYDKGEDFFDHMKKPFKAALNYSAILAEDVDDANNIKFDITDDIKTDKDGKVRIFADKVNVYKVKDEGGELLPYQEGSELKYNEHLYKEYDKSDIHKLTKEKYYLNSKVMLLEIKKNIFENKYFYTYFTDVIMKYIMQLIPSSTIFLIKTFEN